MVYVGVKGYIRLLTVGMRMKITYFWYDEFAQQVNTDMMHTTGEYRHDAHSTMLKHKLRCSKRVCKIKNGV